MWILLVLLFATVLLWGAASYRRLAAMRHVLLDKWRLIDVQLRIRHGTVLRLVNASCGTMAFEREAVAELLDARERAVAATGPVDAAEREEDLTRALERFFAAASSYPALHGGPDMAGLREEFATVDRKIRTAQQSYNDIAGQYNATQRVFPFRFVAPTLGLRQAEGFELTGITALILLILSTIIYAETPSASLRGFSMAASASELMIERTFLQALSARDASADFDVLTAEPHHVGSDYEIKLADFIEGRFKEFGLENTRYEYRARVPWPTERHVDIVESETPGTIELPVDEERLAQDPYGSRPGVLPAYNAYAPSGDVTGEVVYVNYGVPADYEVLDKAHVSVAGKIALARYGASWRGIKEKVAAEHGAIGCLIYSDPHDDGNFQGDAYPDGPFRGLGMIQRGSVIDLPRRPGEPSSDTLPTIPVQPLSGQAAIELFKRIGGDVAPEPWRGSLPVTYHLGGGSLKVRLKLQMDSEPRRLIDVVARIQGSEFPDEWIILGSHRDAWVFGAADPESGQTAVLNVARTLGKLTKTGWRPARTILVASWDGEEPGLIGSTDWVEALSGELNQKAAVYINLDPGSTGPFLATSAVHSLGPFIRDVADAIPSDESDKSLYARWLDHVKNDGTGPPPPLVGALGSGSDYTAFLDHIGITSLDLGLRGPGDFGTYHSVYDDPMWFRRFIDPDFKLNVETSELVGVALLRLADADVLPLDYRAYGEQILEYLDELEREARRRWPDNREVLNFGALKSAARGLVKAGAALLSEEDRLIKGSRDQAALLAFNQKLMTAERDLTEANGLPDRPWYRHVIYAPGLYTGYAVKTLPGVREAIEAGNLTRAEEQSQVLLGAIQRATRTLSF